MRNKAISFIMRLSDRVSNVSPFQVILTMVPLISYCLYRIFISEIDLGSHLIFVILGVLVWTLLEYLIHRFFFHLETKSELLKTLVFVFHGRHHQEPTNTARLLFPMVVSLPMHLMVLFITYQGLKIFEGADLSFSFCMGFYCSYFAYEMLHYSIHSMTFRSGYLKRIQKHHLDHHFSDPDVRFGFTTKFWDLVFRTNSSRKN